MRIVWCDNGLMGVAGHHANLVAALVEEMRGRSIPLAIWSHVRIEPALASDLGAAAVFHSSPYEAPSIGLRAQTGSWLRCAHTVAKDLARAAVRADDVLVFPTARAAEVMGVARWLSSARTAPAAVCLNVMHDDLKPPRRRVASASPWLYRMSLRRLAACGVRSRLLLTTGSPALAEALRRGGADARAYPMPGAYAQDADGSEVTPYRETAVVAYVGIPWVSKGGRLLPDILARCEAVEMPCRIVAQRPAPEFAAMSLHEELAALSRSPLVDFLPGPLDRNAYFRMLADCDLVFLPYDPYYYGRMNSGVFSEALAFGKPVVVPSGTWMSAMLTEGHGAGVVFERFEAAFIVDALRRALERRAELTTRARQTARAWRRTHSIGAFLDRLLADVAAQRSPAPAAFTRNGPRT